MQVGSSTFATEATIAAKNSPFYWPTDGNIAVPGNLVVTGNETVQKNLSVIGNTSLTGTLTVEGETTLQDPVLMESTLDVNGSVQMLQSLTVGKAQPAQATLDVNGVGHFVAPGTNPSVGGIRVARTDGTVDIGFNGPNQHGSIQVNAQNLTQAYNLDINPNGGDVTIGSTVNPASLTVTDNIYVDGLVSTTTGISAVSAAGPGTQFATMTSADGSVSCSGNLSVFPTGSGPAQVGGTQLHKFNSTPGSTDNYLTAGGGKVGFGGIRTPAQQIDVSGNIQASGAILANGYMLALQLDGANECGLFASGDAIILATTSSIGVDVSAIVPNFTPGGRVICTYKNGSNTGGPLSVTPSIGTFVISTPTPVSVNTTVSWMVVSRG